MNFSYLLRESLYSLRSNPLRSSLSILGVVFGVASVVAMLSVGLGAESEVQSLLDDLGAGNLHITADELEDNEWGRVLKATTGLSHRDAVVVSRVLELPDASALAMIAAWRVGDANLALPAAKLDAYGMSANYRKVLGLKLAAGRSFTPHEETMAKPVCLLGEDLAKQWFHEPAAAIGQSVRLDRSWFTVIGVLQGGQRSAEGSSNKPAASKDGEGEGEGGDAPAGEPAGKPAKDQSEGMGLKVLHLANAAVLPISSAEQRLGPLSALAPLERLVLRLPPAMDAIVARTLVSFSLSRLHRGAKVVTVSAADEIIAQKRATTRLFSYFLMTIAMISLVVGGIGIANVMLAGMVERIREVGLRRAIGAKRRHILWQFLTEALTICLLGGVAGGFVGMAVSLVIGQITGWNVAFPWWGHGVAIAIASLVGAGAGLYPALLASRISPIEALQGRA